MQVLERLKSEIHTSTQNGMEVLKKEAGWLLATK